MEIFDDLLSFIKFAELNGQPKVWYLKWSNSMSNSMTNWMDYLASLTGAAIGTALPLFFVWYKDLKREKQRQEYLRARCIRIKNSIDEEIKNCTKKVDQSVGKTTEIGEILNIYSTLERSKEIFDQCDNKDLKSWFHEKHEKMPSFNSPQGKLDPQIDCNGTAIVHHFKNAYCCKL